MDVDYADCLEECISGNSVNEPMDVGVDDHMTLTPPPSPVDHSPSNHLQDGATQSSDSSLGQYPEKSSAKDAVSSSISESKNPLSRSSKGQNPLNLKLDISSSPSSQGKPSETCSTPTSTSVKNPNKRNAYIHNDGYDQGDLDNSKWIVNMSCSLYQVNLETRVYSPIYWTDNGWYNFISEHT